MSDHVPNSNNKLQSMLAQPSSGYKSGVDTPSRFASKCRGPPPISERHLIHALQHQKLQAEKASGGPAEVSAQDDDASHLQASEPDSQNTERPAAGSSSFPSSSSAQRGPASSASPQDRRSDETKDEDRGAVALSAGQGTPRPKRPNLYESKSKAFAFFGQVGTFRPRIARLHTDICRMIRLPS